MALIAVGVVGAFFDLKSRDPLMAPAGAQGRILVYVSAAGTIPIFGLVLWLLLAGIEQRGTLSDRDVNVIFWTGLVWAWVSAVAIAVQGWIVRTRLKDFVGSNFGRVLILAMPPLTSVVFLLVLSLQLFARMPMSSSVSGPAVSAVVNSLVIFGFCGLALPAVTTVANRIKDLVVPRNLARLLFLSNLGVLPVVAGLIWALIQIVSL